NDGSDAGQLQSLLDNIDARIKDVDDERGRYGQALQEAIERLISQLLSIRPTRALVGELKSLQKKLRDVQDDDGAVPKLFMLANLQGQVFAELPARPGFMARIFGGKDAESAQPDVEDTQIGAAARTEAAPIESPPAPAPVHTLHVAPVVALATPSADASALAVAQTPDVEQQQEPAFSKVSDAVCAVINQLLRQIEPPPQAADNHRNILERISIGLNWYELVPTLEDLSFVVLAALERDRGEFHQYLMQLN